MAEFFDHPATGELWFRAAAGGTGGGATSIYEGKASQADITAHARDHARYLRGKHLAAEAGAAEAQREEALHKVEEAVAAVNQAVAGDAANHPPASE